MTIATPRMRAAALILLLLLAPASGVAQVLRPDLTTYAASKTGLVVAALATDIAVLSGNATTVVLVSDVTLSCTQTTAGVVDVQLVKRSTANTAGTATASTSTPLDSNNAAAVSSVLTYTANPTTGTLVGQVDAAKVLVGAPATAAAGAYVWKPALGQTVTLRGTAQQLAVNLNGVTVTGGACNVTFRWIETAGQGF